MGSQAPRAQGSLIFHPQLPRHILLEKVAEESRRKRQEREAGIGGLRLSLLEEEERRRKNLSPRDHCVATPETHCG